MKHPTWTQEHAEYAQAIANQLANKLHNVSPYAIDARERLRDAKLLLALLNKQVKAMAFK